MSITGANEPISSAAKDTWIPLKFIFVVTPPQNVKILRECFLWLIAVHVLSGLFCHNDAIGQ
jgi:hypothetical protein